ncbi:MAG: hypothetical protein HY530_08700 [Chloroflexi bacterium]|nr:hypothetical protein [Chloroflexota bacterium]
MSQTEHPSHDLTFEWGRTAPERLSIEATAIDTKISMAFVSASVIIALVATLKGQIRYDWTIIPFIVAFVSFLGILIGNLRALSAQWFYVADSPKVLREDYWALEPEEAKERYWEWVEKDFETNYRLLKCKGVVLRAVIPLLGIETIALVAWLFLV